MGNILPLQVEYRTLVSIQISPLTFPIKKLLSSTHMEHSMSRYYSWCLNHHTWFRIHEMTESLLNLPFPCFFFFCLLHYYFYHSEVISFSCWIEKDWRWQEWQQALRERPTKGCCWEPRWATVFSLETLFLDNVKYSGCRGCNGHSCANVPSLVLPAQIYLLSLSLTYPKIYWSSPLSVGQGCLRLHFIVWNISLLLRSVYFTTEVMWPRLLLKALSFRGHC